MKDRIGRHRWWNEPVKNPTQTAYRRFERTPDGEWFGGRFKDNERRFKTILNKALKTHYTEMMDEF